MKALIKIFSLLFLFICLTNSIDGQGEYHSNLTMIKSTNELTYEWPPAIDAIYYKVIIEHKTTHETQSQETGATQVNFSGLDAGTYEITVMATYADHSSSIIIEDERVL